MQLECLGAAELLVIACKSCLILVSRSRRGAVIGRGALQMAVAIDNVSRDTKGKDGSEDVDVKDATEQTSETRRAWSHKG